MPTQTLNITLASTNKGKMTEIESLMKQSGLPVELVMPSDLEEVEETGQTFFENALLKANAAQVKDKTHYILAEDSGFEIPVLAGKYGLAPFPGIYSSRWMTQEIRQDLLGINESFEALPLNYEHINAGILKLMANESNRSARYVAALVLQSGDHQTIFKEAGHVEMKIISDNNPRGENGFGYDPIVCPAQEALKQLNWGSNTDEKLTMAELSTEDKNKISHRGKALNQLIKFLKNGRLEKA